MLLHWEPDVNQAKVSQAECFSLLTVTRDVNGDLKIITDDGTADMNEKDLTLEQI